MKLITALQVLCMMLIEPAATACMPGETPIETVSISTPFAAKKPFLVATTPGHMMAVAETWPNETLVAARAGSDATVCNTIMVGKNKLSHTRIYSSPPSAPPAPPAKRGTHIPGRVFMGSRLRGNDGGGMNSM